MRIKILFFLLLFTAAFAAQSQTPPPPPHIAARQMRQHKMIKQGVRNGQLTRPEARHLRQQQRQIAGAKQRMKADGYISRGERARLHMRQEAAGNQIRRKNCNPRRRAM
ncbi:MAG: hypothetical protein IPN33_09645 [Saprospiraceae bacterium]|nr:hypothetical protein [Saprospiraceae bacterium]